MGPSENGGVAGGDGEAVWARIVEPSRPRRHQSGYMRLGDNKSGYRRPRDSKARTSLEK